MVMGVSLIAARLLRFGEFARLAARAFPEMELRLRARRAFLRLQADVGAVRPEVRAP